MNQQTFDTGRDWFLIGGVTWLFMLAGSLLIPPRTGNYFNLCAVYRAYRYRPGGDWGDGFKYVVFRLVEYFVLAFALLGLGMMIVASVPE